MLHITLSDDYHTELQRLRREPGLSPLKRDRVEIVLLAATGWSAPRIAAHLGRCGPTVRTTLHRFLSGGVTRCCPGRRGDGAQHAADAQIPAQHGRKVATGATPTATSRIRSASSGHPRCWARSKPELNRIEPVFKAIKHYDLPERRYTSWTAVEQAIDAAFTRYEQRLAKSIHQPGKAA